jgi:hypothetical protein
MRFGQQDGRTPLFPVARKRDTTTTLHPYTTGGWWFSSSITSFSNVQSVQLSKAPFLIRECGFRLDSRCLGRCPRCPVRAFGVPPVGWKGPRRPHWPNRTLPRPITGTGSRHRHNHRTIDPLPLKASPGRSVIPWHQMGIQAVAGPAAAVLGHYGVTVHRVVWRHHRLSGRGLATCAVCTGCVACRGWEGATHKNADSRTNGSPGSRIPDPSAYRLFRSLSGYLHP